MTSRRSRAEPTAGLDTRIRHDLFDIIARLRDSTGASLRGIPGTRLIQLLNEDSIAIRSVTTRRPTLDDVYLRLTGGRMTAAD